MNINIVLLMLVLTTTAIGQSEWDIFPVMNELYDVEYYNQYGIFATDVGLVQIDTLTGETKLYNKVNSDLQELKVVEVESLSDGTFWVKTDKNLYKFDGEDFTLHTSVYNSQELRISRLRTYNDSLFFIALFDDEYGLFLRVDNEIILVDEQIYGEYVIDKAGNVYWITLGREILKNLNGTSENVSLLDISSILYTPYSYPTNICLDSNDNIYLNHTRVYSASSVNSDIDYFLTYFKDMIDTSIILPHRTSRYFKLEGGELISEEINGDLYILDEINRKLYDLSSEFSGYIDQGDYHLQNLKTLWMSSSSEMYSTKIFRLKSDATYEYQIPLPYKVPLSSKIEVDCDEALYCAGFPSSLIILESGVWSTIYPEYRFENCYISDMYLNPHTCELWGFNFTNSDCLALWNITENEIVEIDILQESKPESISIDSNNNFLINYRNHSIRLDSIGVIHDIEHFRFKEVSYSYYSSNGDLWISGSDQLDDPIVGKLSAGVWTVFEDVSSRKFENWFYEDDSNGIWFKSLNEFYFYKDNEWSNPLENISLSNIKYDLIQDKYGIYWVATSMGLVRWNDSDVFIFNESNSGILSDKCNELKLLNDSTLVISHNSGLSFMRIDRNFSSTSETGSINFALQFSLYPNPTQGSFILSFPCIKDRKIEVFTLDGRLVYHNETPNKSLTISSLMSGDFAAGCYLVRVSSVSGQAVQKIVVN